MLRGWGLVDDEPEVEVPQAQLEIEVETETSPAEVEDSSKVSTKLPSSPHLPINFLAPFHTAKQFGEWLFEVLVGSGEGSNENAKIWYAMVTLFHHYNENPTKIKNLRRMILFGRHVFSSIHRIYFLEGLFLVAISEQQKTFISRIHRKTLAMLWANDL